MSAAIVALSGVLAFALATVIYLVHELLRHQSTLQAMDDERDKAVVRAERAEYELVKRDEKIADLERTADRLAKEPHANPNADLARDDLDTRRLRDAEEAIAAAGDPVPASAGGAVHPGEVPGVAVAAEVQPARPTDRLLDPDESLL